MVDPAQHKRETAPGLAGQWRHALRNSAIKDRDLKRAFFRDVLQSKNEQERPQSSHGSTRKPQSPLRLASLPKDRRPPACALPVARTLVLGLSSRSGHGAIFFLSQQKKHHLMQRRADHHHKRTSTPPKIKHRTKMRTRRLASAKEFSVGQ